MVVNAAGGWVQEIATLAGLSYRNVVPFRRTAVVFDPPADSDIRNWPMTFDVAETFYFKPEAGRIMVSPVDMAATAPCDGRTLLGVSLTGFAQPYKQNFGPFAGEIYHTPYPDAYRGVTVEKALAALEEVFATDIAPDRVAAILIEPVQGDGGFLQAPAEFLQALRKITEKHGIVLICDEIQTGFGRTGKLFGFEHAGIQPDLVTVAKSLAGGFPLSGVVGKAEIMDAPAPGGLGGTYGGNAIACAAALAVLDAFEQDGLLDRAECLGNTLEAALTDLKSQHDFIGAVRGRGYMQALEFVTDQASKQPDPDCAQRIVERARDAGLLVIKCGVHRNIVRFLAPIVLSDEDLEVAISILRHALAEEALSAAA